VTFQSFKAFVILFALPGAIQAATLDSVPAPLRPALHDALAKHAAVTVPTDWTEQKVTASDGAAGDLLGFSVAIDGTTALIGAVKGAAAPGGSDNGSPGAVYVFVNQGGTWTETQELNADDAVDNDQFGTAVSLKGDTAIISAATATVDGNDHQGAAYIFNQAGGTWTQTQKLVADDGAAGDQFGWTVALDGTTAVVGANGNNAAQGAAYVFTLDGGSWSQSAKLTADDGVGNDQLGYAVAIRGTTAMIAAPNATVGANVAQGAVYVFDGSGSAWTQTQKLSNDDGTANQNFAFSLAFDGTTLLSSAPFATVGDNMFQGAVYAFTNDGTEWTQSQKFVADDGLAFDVFGVSLSIDGTDAVITAPFFNGSQGTAYLFSNSDGSGWVQQQKFVASDAVAGEGAAFGYAGAVSNGQIVIGQSLANIDGNTYQGAAYFYSQPPSDVIFADGFDGTP